jgi:hypothetical protein
VLPAEAGEGACAPLRNRGRPSCDKLAQPTPLCRIVRDDRNTLLIKVKFGLRRHDLARDIGNDKRAGGPMPQPRFLFGLAAIASPSQADDIRAHRQQNGDAYGDNDQEEFSHGSASRRPTQSSRNGSLPAGERTS